jgi:hypothetical protein
MGRALKRGDHVQWNSEAGHVRGIVLKKVVSDYNFKGYIHHATKDDPQYLIQSDKTDHVAIHKSGALKLLKTQAKKKLDRRKKSRRTKRSR